MTYLYNKSRRGLKSFNHKAEKYANQVGTATVAACAAIAVWLSVLPLV